MSYDLHQSKVPKAEYLSIVLNHRKALVDLGMKTVRKKNRAPTMLLNLYVNAAMWDGLPVFMAVLDAGLVNGDNRRMLTRLTWQNPEGLEWYEIRALEGEANKNWVVWHQQWWKKNSKSSTRAILNAAKTWKIAGLNKTAGRKASVLLGVLMDEKSAAAVSDVELVAAINCKWPRRRHNNENDQNAPPEEAMASAGAFVRDGAFLLLYKRSPEKAITAMETGLANNKRVIGEMETRYLNRADASKRYVYKADLFKPWLNKRVLKDIDARIADQKLEIGTRCKWLVIRDQFFPELDKHWMIDHLVQRNAEEWIGTRDRAGTRAGWASKDLPALLTERGFKP